MLGVSYRALVTSGKSIVLIIMGVFSVKLTSQQTSFIHDQSSVTAFDNNYVIWWTYLCALVLLFWNSVIHTFNLGIRLLESA